MCFDLSSSTSLQDAPGWVEYVKKHCPEHLSVVLVGTKADLPAEVDEDEISRVATSLGVRYFRTSAKTQLNVEAAFRCMFDLCAVAKERVEAEM